MTRVGRVKLENLELKCIDQGQIAVSPSALEGSEIQFMHDHDADAHISWRT
jgi:hypothetical protein